MSTVKTKATYPQGGTGLDTLGTAGQVLKTNSGANGVEWGTVSGAPTGTVTAFAGSTAPTDWLLCDGSSVSQATYATLYSLIGHTYGSDPGGGNFILPNLKGRMPVGLDSAQTEFDALAETGGAKTHLLTGPESGINAHTHTTAASTNVGGSTEGINANRSTSLSNVNYATSSTAGDTNADTAHNNLQPYLVMNYIVKT